MPIKTPEGRQADTLPKNPFQLEQMSFNLDKQDQFVKSLGVAFIHYRAIPSPIGLKDRGDLRRIESVDIVSSNGMLYKKCGVFTATLLGNQKGINEVEGGIFDNSAARVTMPRFYDQDSPEQANEEIGLCPGDRLEIKDMEVRVVNYQRVDYNHLGVDMLQFPALCVEFLIDSLGREYKHNVHFKIDSRGNIDWIPGANNPGIDPDTGKGRVYSVRYKYNAHYYISQILNEVRITNVTDGLTRKPARMGCHAMIQREYAYHNQTNGDSLNDFKNKETERTVLEPIQPVTEKFQVKVNIRGMET